MSIRIILLFFSCYRPKIQHAFSRFLKEHLNSYDNITALLPARTLVYACLRELFDGPVETRCKPAGSKRSRSEITHYLAKWARSVGMTQEACLEWLTPYALDVLVAISKSSPGAIRHNTKGIVKYVYGVGYPFNCGKEHNVLLCRCDSQCPVYHQSEMPVPKRVFVFPTTDAQGNKLRQWVGPVKAHYKEQYEKSLLVIREMHADGHRSTEIIERLNAENLPTKMGKKWTAPTLCLALKIL